MTPDRRTVLEFFLATVSSTVLGGRALSDPTIATTAASATIPMAATEQLMYSTVRIFQQSAGQLRWGTGFLFRFFNTGDLHVPAIVTNKHVLEGMKDCQFLVASANADGSPNPNKHLRIDIADVPSVSIFHPTADLAILLIGPHLQQLQAAGNVPFLKGLDQSLIPTTDEFKELLPVEQLLTVGFPGQVWDDVHNLPVFHRGYSATAPYIDFKGNKEFLVDFAIWPGASGSPIFLFNDNGYMDRRGNSVLGALRIKLIGVAFGVAMQDVSGNITIQAGPTSVVAPTRLAVPTNLGACISAARILEFEPLLVSKGLLQIPNGYKIRAN
jgi:hypothetical protein